MSQVSKYLRKSDDGYSHWCPGCKQLHHIVTSGRLTWYFSGDLDRPTFNPSVRICGILTVRDENGNWTGEWVRDEHGSPVPYVCHYFLTNGVLNFCRDSTHSLSGQVVPLPELPEFHRDKK